MPILFGLSAVVGLRSSRFTVTASWDTQFRSNFRSIAKAVEELDDGAELREIVKATDRRVTYGEVKCVLTARGSEWDD